MKFRAITETAAWTGNNGFDPVSVFDNQIVDLNEPEDASPAYWWAEACEGKRNPSEDMKVTVKLYAVDDADCTEPLYTFEAWESEMPGFESIKDFESSAAALYDGGWRAEDRDQLMTEYHLTSAEADKLCELLKGMEG